MIKPTDELIEYYKDLELRKLKTQIYHISPFIPARTVHRTSVRSRRTMRDANGEYEYRALQRRIHSSLSITPRLPIDQPIPQCMVNDNEVNRLDLSIPSWHLEKLGHCSKTKKKRGKAFCQAHDITSIIRPEAGQGFWWI